MVALTSDPEQVLAALERDVVAVRFWGEGRGARRVLASAPEAHGVEGMRFNDGKVSPQGTLVVGRMHAAWRTRQPGRLYALLPGAGELDEVLSPEEVWLPNGLDWSADGRTCFFVDSGHETVTAYEADGRGVPARGADGALRPRLLAATPSNHAHVPDGMAIDADGNLWVAPGESGSLVCYDGRDGRELRRVALPVRRPTSCAFGGAGLGELFVTTRVESGEGASAHHGGLFCVRVEGVRGAAGGHAYPLL